jgi:hypothetical protein
MFNKPHPQDPSQSKFKTIEGTVQNISKKAYCYYLSILSSPTREDDRNLTVEKKRTITEWVIEPKTWLLFNNNHPHVASTITGQCLKLTGLAEFPSVYVHESSGEYFHVRRNNSYAASVSYDNQRRNPFKGRDLPIRYRTTRPIEIITGMSSTDNTVALPVLQSSSSLADYAPPSRLPRSLTSRSIGGLNNGDIRQERIANLVNSVRSLLDERGMTTSTPKRIRFIQHGMYSTFSMDNLYEIFPEVEDRMDVNRCKDELLRSGCIALVDVKKELYTPVNFKQFLGPAILMCLHGYKQLRSKPDDDGLFTLEELVHFCLDRFLGKFNVPKHQIENSVKLLVAMKYCTINENGEYRRM